MENSQGKEGEVVAYINIMQHCAVVQSGGYSVAGSPTQFLVILVSTGTIVCSQEGELAAVMTMDPWRKPIPGNGPPP